MLGDDGLTEPVSLLTRISTITSFLFFRWGAEPPGQEDLKTTSHFLKQTRCHSIIRSRQVHRWIGPKGDSSRVWRTPKVEDNSEDQHASPHMSRSRLTSAFPSPRRQIGKRLVAAGLTNDAETRRGYREVLFAHPQIGEWLAGAILFEETLGQANAEGTPFPKVW